MPRPLQLFLIVCLAAAPVAAEVVQSTAGGQVGVRRLNGGFELLQGDRVDLLALAPGFVPRSVEETDAGIVIAGSRPFEGGERLELWLAQGEALVRLEIPASEAAIRTWPSLLVEDGELRAVAWLEGAEPRGLSVRSAARTASGWDPTEVVSRPGRGTQTALSSARLTDGSWVLVWSAFDGHDDEIVWNRRTAVGWSGVRPLQVDNSVPDIVPAVVALGDTALVAWSRFDGEDYRLRLARFVGEDWQLVDWRGEKGSAFPTVIALDDGLAVLYQAADPVGWYLVVVGADGDPETAWWSSTESETRPFARFGKGRGVTDPVFIWPPLGGEGPGHLERPLVVGVQLSESQP